MENYYLGIDVGGTKIKTVVLDEKRELLEQNQILTDDTSLEKEVWKKKIIAIIDLKYKQYTSSTGKTLKCGISAPGLVDFENKMIVHMPERLRGIENFNWSSELQKNITVLNDGHSACFAEYESFYRHKGIQHFLMLTLGTGVGGGIIINEQLYQGNIQRAGHVGHMSVEYNGMSTMTNMPGSLEHAVGNFSVLQRTKSSFQSVEELVKAYEKEDSKAMTWWLESVQKLAIGLASLTNILSPEVIVLGGGIAAGAGNSLLDPLKRYMAEYEWRPGGYQTEVKIAKLGEYAGAIGAALFAKTANN